MCICVDSSGTAWITGVVARCSKRDEHSDACHASMGALFFGSSNAQLVGLHAVDGRIEAEGAAGCVSHDASAAVSWVAAVEGDQYGSCSRSSS